MGVGVGQLAVEASEMRRRREAGSKSIVDLMLQVKHAIGPARGEESLRQRLW